MNKEKATAEEVRAALKAYLYESAELGLEPVRENTRFTDVLEKRLGIDYSRMRPFGRRDAEKRFHTQVMYALNKLAAQGVLVKVRTSRGLLFLLPAEAERRKQASAENARLHQEARDHVAKVKERLRALDITPSVTSNYPVQLSAGDWDKLLDLAEHAELVQEAQKR